MKLLSVKPVNCCYTHTHLKSRQRDRFDGCNRNGSKGEQNKLFKHLIKASFFLKSVKCVFSHVPHLYLFLVFKVTVGVRLSLSSVDKR